MILLYICISVMKTERIFCVLILPFVLLQDSKSEDADKVKASTSTETDKKSTESEEKKREVKTKMTTVRANITWQTTIRDLPDPTKEKLKQSKKL